MAPSFVLVLTLPCAGPPENIGTICMSYTTLGTGGLIIQKAAAQQIQTHTR